MIWLQGKRLPIQNLMMKSQNDSISGISFIFLYFGKKSGSQLGIQSLYPLKGKMIRFYQTKRLNEPETIKVRNAACQAKRSLLGLLVLTCTHRSNLSCLSVQSRYKTKCSSLHYSIFSRDRSPSYTSWGIL